MRILVIEDEPRLLLLLRKGLTEHGYAVSAVVDGAQGLKLCLDNSFDVILLDVGLPGLSGYDVAQILRTRKDPAYILMLTAFDKEDDIVRGLNLGADDYLTKPFSFPELLARIRSIMRASHEALPQSLTTEDLNLNLLRRRVSRSGQAIELTRTEFLLLEILMQHAPAIVPREILLEGVWGKHPEVGQGALDVLVNALRSKVDAPFARKLIHTSRGSGYALASKPGFAAAAGHGAI